MKKKILPVLAVVCLILCGALVWLTVYMGQSTNLVTDAGVVTGQTNNVVAYDGATDVLLVGTRTGGLIAYNNVDKSLLWEVQTDSTQPITAIKVHAESDLVYAGSDDMNIYVYDISEGTRVNTIMANGRVNDFDFSSDDSTLCVATKTNEKSNIRVIDVATGEMPYNNKYTYGMKGIAFTSDEQHLIVVTKHSEIMNMNFDGTVNVNVNNVLKGDIKTLRPVTEDTYMAVDINGLYAIFDENINVLRTGKIEMIQGALIVGGAATPDGYIAVGTESGYVYVVNPKDETIYSYRQKDFYTVSDATVDEETVYLTGYGDFVDSISLERLSTVALLQKLHTAIIVGMILTGLAGIFLLLMYFPATNKGVRTFFKALWKYRLAYILLIPTFVILILFNYTPVVLALTRAFTNWSVKHYTPAELRFVGLTQFKSALVDTHFLYGVRNLIILMLTGFVKLLTMPLIAAYLVYSFRSDKKKFTFRFLFVLPIVVPGVVGSLMWKEIYNVHGGLDQLLKALGREEWIHVWLGEEKTALWSIIFMGIPYIGAFPFLLYYGGLTSIDSNLYEAARIDGANRSKIFWRVQLPMIMPQVKLLIVLQFIGSVQDYGGIYLMTGGGPGHSTYTPGLALYYDATANGQYARACAMGIMMFIVIMIGTYFNNKIKAENYGS